jgi:outer membrane protein assembly factor BamB
LVNESSIGIWPGWLGPLRSGIVAGLPERLSDEPNIEWERVFTHASLGGIAATHDKVVFTDRDEEDFHDLFRCVDANTGEDLWTIERLAIGALDYGNSTRATPLIDAERVVFLSAFGVLVCASLNEGSILWERDLAQQFPAAKELPWGYCGSPLLVDGKIIVSPGSASASVAAFDVATGEVVWTCEGIGPSYGSMTVATLGGVVQIVGHDASSLGGWDVATGQRLWTVQPEREGDFNVPTPLVYQGKLLVTTENNGARLFAFDERGKILPDPVATNWKLHPDMSTAVVAGELAFCVKDFLFCCDLADGLKERWRMRDAAISDYAAILAAGDRILVIGNGELMLMGSDGDQEILSRVRLFEERLPIYSYPALVGNRLFIRGEHRMLCVRLD